MRRIDSGQILVLFERVCREKYPNTNPVIVGVFELCVVSCAMFLLKISTSKKAFYYAKIMIMSTFIILYL